MSGDWRRIAVRAGEGCRSGCTDCEAFMSDHPGYGSTARGRLVRILPTAILVAALTLSVVIWLASRAGSRRRNWGRPGSWKLQGPASSSLVDGIVFVRLSGRGFSIRRPTIESRSAQIGTDAASAGSRSGIAGPRRVRGYRVIRQLDINRRLRVAPLVAVQQCRPVLGYMRSSARAHPFCAFR